MTFEEIRMAEMAWDELCHRIEKAQQDSSSGAMFHPQDLSNVIYLNGVPEFSFMKRLMVDPNLNGDPHIWSEMAFADATGTGSYFYEGDAPAIVSTVPTRKSNTIFQVGRCAEVTDKQLALFANPGGWRLHSGNSLQRFADEMALQMKGRILETMGDMSYIFINGNKYRTLAASLGRTDVQCHGALNQITNNSQTGGGTSYITDTLIIALAKQIRDRKTGRNPQVLYTNSNQKKTINTWTSNIWFGQNRNLEAGKDVSSYNTGFFIVSLEIDDHIPAGSCMMIDHSMWWRMDLKPLRAEELARVKTSIKRMVTYYGTLKCGNDRSSGKIIGLVE